jgi:hypothetical protein
MITNNGNSAISGEFYQAFCDKGSEDRPGKVIFDPYPRYIHLMFLAHNSLLYNLLIAHMT